ncbi:S8 family serine peptidase [Cutibacterium sp. WCA-380-WT-3A]|uniref:S8 family serine peptidase n=1 Tax=Cutibacterium porci TaxID=2605781 RepID=A0A7K0J9P1_9ACTN|nr:S8 family peptidase [Cutibacterium porci]MSS46691.1 S8 family serine peptidase [Cutibacterium porci]
MASRRTLALLLSAVTGASLAVTAIPGSAAPGFTTSPLRTADSAQSTSGFVIHFKDHSASVRGMSRAARTSSAIHVTTASLRGTVDRAVKARGAHVTESVAHANDSMSVRVSRGLDATAAKAFASEIEHNPEVESVEPVLHMTINESRDVRPAAVSSAPNDQYWNHQWGLNSEKGIDAPGAWRTSTGAGVTVAVIDSGITRHPDLDGKILPGYDFISDGSTAGDGDGRDSDPSDEGDWTRAGTCTRRDVPSSWHGTHVAGIIGASTNNGEGVAGAAPAAKILPVRALGHCGGTDVDIADGITWASGGKVPGVPTNPHPAKVINLSLGGSASYCPVSYQRAIDGAVSRGSTIVVAAGNEARDASKSTPANCGNVVVVGATGETGAQSYYSNYGSGVDVSAPGGDDRTGDMILSTVNDGKTTPGSPAYGYMEGTSQAAPHVSGVVALMVADDPGLTPARIEEILKRSVNPAMCTSRCGTGIIDAREAVQAAKPA